MASLCSTARGTSSEGGISTSILSDSLEASWKSTSEMSSKHTIGTAPPSGDSHSASAAMVEASYSSPSMKCDDFADVRPVTADADNRILVTTGCGGADAGAGATQIRSICNSASLALLLVHSTSSLQPADSGNASHRSAIFGLLKLRTLGKDLPASAAAAFRSSGEFTRVQGVPTCTGTHPKSLTLDVRARNSELPTCFPFDSSS
mmetsp:Transcript_28509/g.51841  ORF Transcript_28509/g.51841 Transcript_28509/m.51841 type:complete len:205 (-) Transcript_28509:1754-2368(-)